MKNHTRVPALNASMHLTSSRTCQEQEAEKSWVAAQSQPTGQTIAAVFGNS